MNDALLLLVIKHNLMKYADSFRLKLSDSTAGAFTTSIHDHHEIISIKSGTSSRLVIEKTIAMVEIIDW